MNHAPLVWFKGGYLNFSYLTELRNIYRSITGIYMQKIQIINN